MRSDCITMEKELTEQREEIRALQDILLNRNAEVVNLRANCHDAMGTIAVMKAECDKLQAEVERLRAGTMGEEVTARPKFKRRPLAIDLFCGAGGAAMGLFNAGFLVHGYDIREQPHYPFRFVCGDALAADLSRADFVWASPPCQAHTSLRFMPTARKHADLIPATRAKLKKWGGVYIIENVVGAPLLSSVMLCGSMFGLQCEEAELRRHRLFETNIPLLTPNCQHGKKAHVIGVYGTGGGCKLERKDGRLHSRMFNTEKRAEAMGIDWMTGKELSQAIPPAYSEYLGQNVLNYLEADHADK